MSDELTAIANDLDSFVHDMREDGNSDATALWLEKRVSALRALASQEKQEPVASIVPCYTLSGKRVALYTEHQHLPIGTELFAAPQPAPGWDEALKLLEEAAERQKAYFNKKQRGLPSIDDFTDSDGNVSLPDDITPLLAQAGANGRYSEADWWLSTIRKAFRSKPTDTVATVAVKPLEWLSQDQPFFAITSIAKYRISKISSDTWETTVFSYPGDKTWRHKTEADAKAAAQADYEQRIRSALTNQPLAGDSNASVAPITEADIRAHVGDGVVPMREVASAVNGILAERTGANASVEARLREALVIARRRIAYLGLFAGKSHEHSNDIDFLPMIDEALSQHPHASDCARDGTIPSGYGEYTPITVSGSTSDRPADVTVEDIAPIICEALFGIYVPTETAVSSISGQSRIAASALLDTFTVGRR